MKALLSWDVDPADPDFQRILFDLGSILPPESTTRITTWTALIDPVNSASFRRLARDIEGLVRDYRDQLFVVFSLHPAGSVIWGRWRQPGARLLESDDTLGFGAGSDLPEEP